MSRNQGSCDALLILRRLHGTYANAYKREKTEASWALMTYIDEAKKMAIKDCEEHLKSTFLN